MASNFKIMTLIKKKDAPIGGVFCSTKDGQPLVLSTVEGRAFVTDLNCKTLGFISNPEHSNTIVAKMAAGEILLAKAVGGCFCVARSVLIWSEGTDKEEIVSKRKTREIEKA